MTKFQCGHEIHQECDMAITNCPVCGVEITRRENREVPWDDNNAISFLQSEGVIASSNPVEVSRLLRRPNRSEVEALASLEGISPSMLARMHSISFPGLEEELFGGDGAVDERVRNPDGGTEGGGVEGVGEPEVEEAGGGSANLGEENGENPTEPGRENAT
jgi:hypothetical protein